MNMKYATVVVVDVVDLPVGIAQAAVEDLAEELLPRGSAAIALPSHVVTSARPGRSVLTSGADR